MKNFEKFRQDKKFILLMTLGKKKGKYVNNCKYLKNDICHAVNPPQKFKFACVDTCPRYEKDYGKKP